MKSMTYQCSANENIEELLMLKAYCDSDYAGDKEIRASVTGYFIHQHYCLIV